MRPVLSPVSPVVLQKQLQHCRFLRMSRRGNFELYAFRHRTESPLLLEIGRLRELSFRLSGSGTGKAFDLDEFDTGPNANLQLIAWDAHGKKIAGGYRLQHFSDAFDGVQFHLPSAELFNYSEEFRSRYLPKTMEIGRSWIHPEYQSSGPLARSIFVLDSLWEGLGAVVQSTPQTEFLFGKVTVPRSYPPHVRDLIIGLLNCYFGKQRGLVRAKKPLQIAPHIGLFYNGLDLKRAMSELRNTIGFYGYRIPPLISAYIKLSDHMLAFDSAINTSFGQVPDTAVLFEVAKLHPDKRARYFGCGNTLLTDVA